MEIGGIAGKTHWVDGCTSAATVSGSQDVGGIAGAYSRIKDCLVLGAAVSGTSKVGAITGHMNSYGNLSNNYYTAGTTVNSGTASGHGAGSDGDVTGISLARSITAGTNITLDFAGTATTEYSPNGISVYAAGMKYANALYVGSSTTDVSLLLSYSSTPLTGYLATTGTLSGTATTGSNDAYTLTMANANAVIYAAGTGNSVTLTETNPIAPLTAWNGQQTKVSFERTGLTAGKYSTICLPYDFTASESCTFYTFKGVTQDTQNNWVADIEETTAALTANTPYIFTTATATSVTFSNPAVIAAASYSDAAANTLGTNDTDWTFQGTYSAISLPKTGEHAYGFAAGDGSTVAIGSFVHLVSGASAAPFRAYLKYTGTDANWAKARTRSGAETLPSRIIVRIVGANGSTTTIGTFDTTTGEITTDDWYTLDGRKLSGKPSAKGLYIHNGRKEVLK